MINEDDDDFLKSARRERGALPSGEYAAEIVPGSVVPFTTPQTVGIDADDAPVPAPLGDAERLVEGAILVRDRQLPPEFSNATMLVSPTSSSGLRSPTLFRGRLYFLLARLIPLGDLRAWAQGVKAVGGPVDPAVMQAGQPIFTARPQFVGMDDPIPPHLLATVVSGVRDRVDLNSDRYAVKVAEIERRLLSVVACTGPDWRGFLRSTLGGELSFHEPLKMGLGRAARSGEPDEAIIAFTLALLAKRADPARRAQYNAAWIGRTLKSFRAKDGLTRSRLEAARASLFVEV